MLFKQRVRFDSGDFIRHTLTRAPLGLIVDYFTQSYVSVAYSRCDYRFLRPLIIHKTIHMSVDGALIS